LTPPSSTNERQPEPTFFVDQNLRGQFSSYLRLAGLKVEELEDYLAPSTPDVEWIPFVGERRWVAITMDSLRGDVEEHAALMAHGVKVFIIVGKGTHRQRAEFFIRKIRWVRQTIMQHGDHPFVARMSLVSGGHSLMTFEDFLQKRKQRWR
jgi:hypothetical protein